MNARKLRAVNLPPEVMERAERQILRDSAEAGRRITIAEWITKAIEEKLARSQ